MRSLYYGNQESLLKGKRNVVLFAYGEFDPQGLSIDHVSQSIVAAVDGGLKWCKELNITPQLILGDFDSITEDLHQEYTHVPWVKKENQNQTDLEFAVEFFLKDKVNRITCIAGLGGRTDHTLTNFYLASRYPLQLCFETPNEFHFVAAPGTVALDTQKGQTISLFPINGPAIVETEGLQWELSAEQPLNRAFFSQSNRATKSPVSLSVLSGEVHVIVIIENK